MKIHVYDNAQAIGQAAASLFAAQVLAKPNCVLGLATGSTPIPTYQEMAKLYEKGVVDYSQVTTFNLDEYLGLERSHDQSYYYFMQQNLFQHINVPQENIHVLWGTAPDPQQECRDYEQAIQKAGGIDLQILGIGNNGHIAFNEPDEVFAPETRVVNLTESTIQANQRFFASADEVPRQAVSMGIGSIFRARKIVLIATGEKKADAVAAMVHGPVDPKCPASILQLHPDTVVLLDREAAAQL